MPIPEPDDDQSEDEFISECMSDEKVKEEFGEGSEQAYAVCKSKWDEAQETNESSFESYIKGDGRLEDLFEPSGDSSSVIERYVMDSRKFIEQVIDGDVKNTEVDEEYGTVEFYKEGRRFELEYSIVDEQPFVELEHMVIDREIEDVDDVFDELRAIFNRNVESNNKQEQSVEIISEIAGQTGLDPETVRTVLEATVRYLKTTGIQNLRTFMQSIKGFL